MIAVAVLGRSGASGLILSPRAADLARIRDPVAGLPAELR
jgi:hypothetical protein